MELCYTNNPKSLFRKYAKLVTWFANTQLGKDYLSHSFFIPKEKIALFLPNGYIVKRGKEYQMTVTTTPVYAPKLYPALQAIDFLKTNIDESREIMLWILGLRGQPAWATNKLLSSLTVNPDANVETTSVDGYTTNGNANFATARGASTASFATDDSGNTLLDECYFFGGTTYYISRSFELFDTSALTSSATISAATFSLYKNATAVNNADTVYIALVTTTPASNTAIVADDYDQSGSTKQAADVNYASISTSAYFDMTLNATGLGNISLTGITKFGTRCSRDLDNSAPTGTNSIEIVSSDTGSNKPKLVITYELPSTQYLKERYHNREDMGGVSLG